MVGDSSFVNVPLVTRNLLVFHSSLSKSEERKLQYGDSNQSVLGILSKVLHTKSSNISLLFSFPDKQINDLTFYKGTG
jgi:hypothetical protein